MKTAVSIPNELFDVAERLARRSRKSRSRLFSDALREYVARRSPDKVTEAMDEALAEIGESNDPFVAAASADGLSRASGDLAGRDLVGRFASSDRLGPRVS